MHIVCVVSWMSLEYYLWLVQYIVMLYFRTLNLFSCDDCTAYHYCIHEYVVLVSARVFML